MNDNTPMTLEGVALIRANARRTVAELRVAAKRAEHRGSYAKAGLLRWKAGELQVAIGKLQSAIDALEARTS
jgi:hypothetical protein